MLVENIFKMTHDEMRHCRFDRVFEHFHELTINKTSCQLQVYINKCSDCDKNQIHYHKFYNDFQSILSLSISFHTLTINFIFTLLVFEENYNVMLIITNKFIKNIQLILKKNI